MFLGASKMKGKTNYKLSPNEEARVLKEEKERRRKLRIQQVCVIINTENP